MGYQAAFHSSGFRVGQGLARAYMMLPQRLGRQQRGAKRDSEEIFVTISSSEREISNRERERGGMFNPSRKIRSADNYGYYSLNRNLPKRASEEATDNHA